MFSDACQTLRERIYGVCCSSQMHPGGMTTFSTGTAFMISPGILATVSHAVHQAGDPEGPLHQAVQVIRAPEIGQEFETASIVVEDRERDIAFLQIPSPRNTECVALHESRVSPGTSCGSLGFPLSAVVSMPNGQAAFNLVERFQGAAVAAYNLIPTPTGRHLGMYEADAVSYPGSSGCPAFLRSGAVFAMIKGSLIQPGADAGNGHPAGAEDLRRRLSISVWIPAGDIAQLARQFGLLR
jgi:hypothetical protein